MRNRPINIIGGFYRDPNLHWSRQDTLNWIPVRAEQEGTLTPFQLRDAPGVKPFVRITRTVGEGEGTTIIDVGPVRGMRNVEGKLFVVAAQTLYQISNTGVAIPFGTIPGVGRVSMTHNQRGLGNELLIVNGSAGYVYNTQTQILGKITDEGYPGAFIADFMNQYLVQVEPQGRFWFHSDLADAYSYNTLDQYEAESLPDRIVSLIRSNTDLLVFGKESTDFFRNTGAQTGTFESSPNTSMDVGCAAKFTPRRMANSVYWLDDKRIVRRLVNGYTDERISTDAIDSAFSECTATQVAGAYAFTWETNGNKVYYITVPGMFTFGYDVLTGQWHRRSTWSMAHWDAVDAVFWNGQWVIGSGQNGRLYILDPKYKLDRCDPLARKRTTGKLWDAENEMTLNNVELKFQTGGVVSVCVPFPVQPDGPSISGEAPDGDTGSPYSFPYTTTPGDAPISRTVLMPGTFVLVGGVPRTLEAAGLTWDEATATLSSSMLDVGSIIHLVLRVYDENGLYADHVDDIIMYGVVRWDEATDTGGQLAYSDDHMTVNAFTNTAGFVTADTSVDAGDWYWETTTGWRLSSGSLINHWGQSGLIRESDDAYGLVIARIGATSDGGAVSPTNTLFPEATLYPNWIPPANTNATAIVRHRLVFASGTAKWSVAIDAGTWTEIMSVPEATFYPYATSRGSSQDGDFVVRKVTISSRPSDFTYPVPTGATPLGVAVGS